MPKAKRAGKALVAADARAALARLASMGAYAIAVGPPEGGRDRWAIYAPRNGFAEPVLCVTRLAIEYGLRKGWLVPGEADGRLRLAAAGLRALRTAKATPLGNAQPRAGQRAAEPAQASREGPLSWLRGRKDRQGRPLITDAQFDAGRKLASDFWQAQLSPRVTADWSAVAPGQRMRRTTPGAGVEMNDRAAAARQRVSLALEAVGPELARHSARRVLPRCGPGGCRAGGRLAATGGQGGPGPRPDAARQALRADRSGAPADQPPAALG